MNILMVTNTYTPHVGGVARSVSSFTQEYRRRGHRVIVIAPTFEGMPLEESDVIRMPAIQNFNGSNFSVPMPAPGYLSSDLAAAPPDIVHSHHPFLLGDTALRVGATWNAPVIFTHHTLYDQYVHYLGAESTTLQRIATDIATGYCNLCQGAIAPSESLAQMLREHGVQTPIAVIPTGVEIDQFKHGDGSAARAVQNIPQAAFVVGHVGRLAPEKNLKFLAAAVAQFLSGRRDAYFLVVGCGPSQDEIKQLFAAQGLSDRLRLAGVLEAEQLAGAYRAMDVFAFASQTETQGLVLTEAMAAGVPVVAVDAPGVRDVLVDGKNGRMLPREDQAEFVQAIQWLADLPEDQRRELQLEVAHTAETFSLERSAERALEFYQERRAAYRPTPAVEDSAWSAALRWIEMEWEIMAHHAKAVGGALVGSTTDDGGS